MRAVVTRERNRIMLWTSRPQARLQEVLPGAYFSKAKGLWSFPLTMDHCRALRAHYGSALEIRPALSEWAYAEVAKERSQAALGRSLDGEGLTLPRVEERYPALAKRLSNRPYQIPAARFLAEGRFIINADTPGLGKTTETIAGIVESGVPGPYLVAAPQTSLDSVWERELAECLPDARVVVVGLDRYSRERRNEILYAAMLDGDQDNMWVIINPEMLRTQTWWECPKCGEVWKASDHPRSSIIDCGDNPKRARVLQEHSFPQLFAGEWGAIIIDESQRVLIRKSGTPTLVRNGARLLATRPADGLRASLSGTPMRGRPHQLWGTLNWLYPQKYRGFWSWAELYYNVVIGYNASKNIRDLREERRDALYTALGAMMIRRTKHEVRDDLPPKLYGGTRLVPSDESSPIAVWLPMGAKQQKAYDQMLSRSESEVDGGTLTAIGGLAELTRLKQFASAYGRMEARDRYVPTLPSNKFDWVVQFLTERNIIDHDPEEPVGKVVIVSQWTQMLEAFTAGLTEIKRAYSGRTPLNWVTITGKVTGARRTEAQDIFNDPKSNVSIMFLNTTAGGVSITLDAADDMILLDETHVPDDQEQAEERINNRRPEEKVVQRTYWYLKSLGTVEEAIAKVNLGHDAQQKELLDSRRGVTYVRQVFDEMRRSK
jgi:SNF2 family DNA or RNA helicase